MEQISNRYFKIFYTKLPHYVESENNLKYSTPDAACFDICASVAAPIPFCRNSVSCARPV